MVTYIKSLDKNPDDTWARKEPLRQASGISIRDISMVLNREWGNGSL